MKSVNGPIRYQELRHGEKQRLVDLIRLKKPALWNCLPRLGTEIDRLMRGEVVDLRFLDDLGGEDCDRPPGRAQ